jgi:hypothetical protein
MFYRKQSNQYILENQPFTIEGTQYSSTWLNLSNSADKLKLGLEEVKQTNSPADRRYYWVEEILKGAELSYKNTPKDLTEIKLKTISDINKSAYSRLANSDWLVFKAFESGKDLDPSWKSWRQAVRDVTNTTEALINNANSVDDIKIIISAINWPVSPT